MSVFKDIYYKTIPFKYRYGYPLFKDTLSFLEESQYWAYEKLEEYQRREFVNLICYVYYYVPYYREVMDDRGLTPTDFKEISDIKKLPILTKDLIRQNFHKLQTTHPLDLQNTKLISTSGSTGEKLSILINDDVYKKEAAFILRAYHAHNSNLYDDKSVWLRRYTPAENEPFYKYDNELRRLYLTPYRLSYKTLIPYVYEMMDYKPKILVGYPSSVYILCLLLREHKMKFPSCIKSIHLASETVLDKWVDLIKEVTGITPKSHYGMVEKVSMMFQCSESDCYHESLEYGITEIEDNHILGTGFINYTMPLIRYKVDDILVENSGEQYCACGSKLLLRVKRVDGRSDDILMGEDGMVPGVNIYSMMRDFDNIKMFQIIQSSSVIHVKLAVNEKWSCYDARRLTEQLKRRLGRNIPIEISLVNSIERDNKSNKIRCIINERQ
jgi:phenylacetate-CoA ligase